MSDRNDFLVNFMEKLSSVSNLLHPEVLRINSTEEFNILLRRERSRADRNHKEFSLVVFTVGNGDKPGTHAKSLVKLLSSRLRISDEVGWFDENSIAVLLPDTSSEGAWKLVEEMKQKINQIISSPICNIYVYPSPKWPEEII